MRAETRITLTDALWKAKELGSKGIVLLWNSSEDTARTRHIEHIADELTDDQWQTKTGVIRNEEHEGYIEATSYYLMAAPRKTIERLGKSEFTATETQARMEDILDEGDGMLTDCFVWQRTAEYKENQIDKTHGARSKT
jgi:hypothetical protein